MKLSAKFCVGMGARGFVEHCPPIYGSESRKAEPSLSKVVLSARKHQGVSSFYVSSSARLHFVNAKKLFLSDFCARWDFLAETNLAVRRTNSFSEVNSRMVVLLDKVRTHFESE